MLNCADFDRMRTHLIRLSDTMSTREGLNIVVRIPIGIVDDDSVSCGQVDSQTTGPG